MLYVHVVLYNGLYSHHEFHIILQINEALIDFRTPSNASCEQLCHELKEKEARKEYPPRISLHVLEQCGVARRNLVADVVLSGTDPEVETQLSVQASPGEIVFVIVKIIIRSWHQSSIFGDIILILHAGLHVLPAHGSRGVWNGSTVALPENRQTTPAWFG